MSAIKTSLAKFLPSVESYSATPYWDFKQWSWGYGTRVPGSPLPVDGVLSKTWPANIPKPTTTRERAFADMQAYFNNDLMELLPLVKVQLKPNQWAAFLSFSYNLGRGNADNLLPNINARDNAALEVQWKKYVLAGGVRNENLVARREKEWQLWIS